MQMSVVWEQTTAHHERRCAAELFRSLSFVCVLDADGPLGVSVGLSAGFYMILGRVPQLREGRSLTARGGAVSCTVDMSAKVLSHRGHVEVEGFEVGQLD